jgi:hypothetical protein
VINQNLNSGQLLYQALEQNRLLDAYTLLLGATPDFDSVRPLNGERQNILIFAAALPQLFKLLLEQYEEKISQEEIYQAGLHIIRAKCPDSLLSSVRNCFSLVNYALNKQDIDGIELLSKHESIRISKLAKKILISKNENDDMDELVAAISMLKVFDDTPAITHEYNKRARSPNADSDDENRQLEHIQPHKARKF